VNPVAVYRGQLGAADILAPMKLLVQHAVPMQQSFSQ